MNSNNLKMKKSLHFWKLACLAAVSVMVVSCCGGGADYRNLLPADSFMTMSVNPASLMQKSGAGDIEQHPLFARLKAELDKTEGMTAEEKEYLLAMLKNPCESGIDLKKDLFFFMSMESLGNMNIQAPNVRGGLLLPVGDKAKLDAIVARINEKSGATLQNEGGISVIKLGEEDSVSALCAYNDVAFIVYGAQGNSENAVETVKKLFAQKGSEGLMGNKVVAEQLSGNNDINMVMVYSSLVSLMDSNPMMSSMPMMEALKGATMVSSVNFEKGRIVSGIAMSYKDKESEQKMQDFYAYVKPQTGALLRYVPQNTVGAMAYGLDGAKMYSVFSAMPGYGMLMANPMVKQAMDAFDGDCVISFSGMTADGRYPVASLLAQVKDPAVVQTIVSNMPGMPVQQTAEGEYTMNLGGVTVLFGVKGDVLYCTTDAVVKSALDGAEIESLASMVKIFKGQSGTFFVDFEGVNTIVAQLVGGNVTPQVESALSVLAMFDDMEAYGTMKGGTVIVNMTDKEQNSFKTICDKIGELIRQYIPEANI